jgi:phage baseplate assembly protein W
MGSRTERQFLGVGFKFPLQVTARGTIAMSRYEQKIEESIYMILGTAPGERLMLPEFGCGIHDQVFAPNNSVSIALIVDQVRRALVMHEPRIDVLTVRATTTLEEPNVLLIRVDYRVRSNNTLGNLVYPFHVTEGS